MVIGPEAGYNVKAVATETGLSADTLRAWERRYGIPKPSRSSGRQRTYTRRDIELLKWLVSRQREGLTISRAIEMFTRMSDSGGDPLSTEILRAHDLASQPPDRATARLREEWLSACLRFDGAAADATLSEAFALHSVEVVCTEVLQAGVAVIGERWYAGEVTPHQEHYASALATRQLERLLATAPAPYRDGRIVLGCAGGDTHAFGILMLAVLLRRRGWDCVYLGADVPTSDFATTLQSVHPAVVVLSANQLRTAATLREAAGTLSAVGATVTYGGTVFVRTPALRASIPAHYLGDTLAGAPGQIERLVSARPPSPTVQIESSLVAARAHFGALRPAIDADVLAQLPEDALSAADASVAAGWMAVEIDAALALGDLSLLDAELDWALGQPGLARLTPGALPLFVATYSDAAARHLDQRGWIVVEWLRGASARLAEGGSDRRWQRGER